jgi:myosin heavy subunit
MAADALARLAKKEEELETAKNDYHDLLVQRDGRIEELEKTLNSLRSDVSNIRKEKDDLAREISTHKETAINVTAAKEKVDKELKQQKGFADHDREVAEKLYKESVEHGKEMKLAKEASRKFKERISELTATNKQLHEQVDDLEAQKETLQTANSHFALKQEGDENDVSHATKEFEQMFQDLGRELDLNGYVSHVRDLLSTGHLKRQSSQLSLERQLSPQKSNQELRTVTGKSLQDQLAAVDDASSEHSVPRSGEAEDDEDDTITDLGLGRTFNEYDYFVRLQKQEQKIIELEKINAELLSKTKKSEAITTADGTPRTDANEHANEPARPPSPQLTFSNIQSVQTFPQDPEPTIKSNSDPTRNLSIALYPSAETKPVRPVAVPALKIAAPPEPSITELWQRLPWWYKLVLFAMLSLYAILFAGVVSERFIWLSANDLTRQHIVRMAGSGVVGVFSPILMAVDSLVGVDNGLLG